jgi:hypothetical protein
MAASVLNSVPKSDIEHNYSLKSCIDNLQERVSGDEEVP